MICVCGHFDTNHTEEGRGYCFVGNCSCGFFREDSQATNAARSAAEDEENRDRRYENGKDGGGTA